MSNRITGAMLTGATLNDLNSALNKLQRSAAELSSGHSILEASDNPYGASRAIDLQSQLDGLSSYASSVRTASPGRRPPSGAMANIDTVAPARARTVLEAANGTNNAGDLEEHRDRDRTADRNHQAGRQHPVRRPVRLLRHADLDRRRTHAAKTTNTRGNTETIARRSGRARPSTSSTDLSSVLGNGRHPATASCSTCCARSSST